MPQPRGKRLPPNADAEVAMRAVKKELVLEELRKGYTLNKASKVAGSTYGVVLGWRQDDPQFAEAVIAAMTQGNHALHDEAVRRAVEGVQEPVYYQGVQVGYVAKYSDRLLEFLMARRIPEFREHKSVDLRTPDGVQVTTLTADEAANLYGAVMRDEADL